MHPNPFAVRPPDIAFLGKARTGKSTAASILERKYGHKPMAFADPLRDVARDLDPIVGDFGRRYIDVLDALGYDTAKAAYPEVRLVLQRLGVAVREHVAEDVWVRALEARVEAEDADQPIAVTDVRFPNEVDYLKDAGFVLIRLERGEAGAGIHSGHVSETALADYPADFVYRNDGSTEALEGFLDGVVSSRPRRAW